MNPPSSLRVRPWTAADVETICAFQLAMAAETEDKGLDPERLARGVAAMIDDPHKGRYIVAERADGVVGCLALTYEWSDWRGAWFWWIQSVYVAPAARRSGVYGSLYAGVLAEARSAGDVFGIRLYVERDNQGAQATYESLGMRASDYRMYERGLDE